MTSFFDRLALSAPIIQAPMAGAQNHLLAAAVCKAGGLGYVPAAMLSPEDLRAQLQALQSTSPKAYNVNFFCHAPPSPDAARQTAWHNALVPYYLDLGLDTKAIPSGPGRVPFNHAAADVLQDFRPAVVSFHFGLPSADLLARVRSWGSLIVSSATTVDEGLWLQAQGVDAVIAQGLEAGGHRGMFLREDLAGQTNTFDLLSALVSAVHIPVIAAGGLADAEGQVLLHHQHPALQPRTEHEEHRGRHGRVIGEAASDPDGEVERGPVHGRGLWFTRPVARRHPM